MTAVVSSAANPANRSTVGWVLVWLGLLLFLLFGLVVVWFTASSCWTAEACHRVPPAAWAFLGAGILGVGIGATARRDRRALVVLALWGVAVAASSLWFGADLVLGTGLLVASGAALLVRSRATAG